MSHARDGRGATAKTRTESTHPMRNRHLLSDFIRTYADSLAASSGQVSWRRRPVDSLLVLLMLVLIAPALSQSVYATETEAGTPSSAVGDVDHSAGLDEVDPVLAPQGAPTHHAETHMLYGLEQDGADYVLSLFDFEEDGELARFVYGDVNVLCEQTANAQDGAGAASVTFYRSAVPSNKAAYFHVLFSDDRGHVRDWSAFSSIGALLYNTEQFPVTLQMILVDVNGKRAVQMLTLTPGQWFAWRWPLQRAISQGVDISQIERLSFKQIDTTMVDINTILIDRVQLRGPDAAGMVRMLERDGPGWTHRQPITSAPKAKYIPSIDFSDAAKNRIREKYGYEVDGVISTEVIVAGGGMAGCSAAIGSARAGADTLLVEVNGFLGGMGTAAMVYPWMPSMAGGEQIIEGVFMDYYTRLASRGDADRAPGNPSVINFDKEALKMTLQEMVIESGSKLLLHTWVGGALMEGNSINGVVGYNKSGTIAIESKRVVDCTGDGDVANYAKAPIEQGRGFDIYGQAVTLFFRMGNVDFETAFREQNRRLVRYEQQIPAEYLFADLFKKGKAKGELDPDLPISTIYFEKTMNHGVVSINATRVFEVDTTSALDLTYAEVESRRQVDQLAKFLRKNIPGFQNSFLQETATQIGVRESRRIVGEYMLTGEDVIHATKFPDVVARGSFGIDIHCADYTGCGITGLDLEEGLSYDIPYRSLVPKEIDNLLMGGRCISVTHIALGSTRIQPIAAATGQAAGIAAAVSIQAGYTPRDVPYRLLRAELIKQRVNLGSGPIPLMATRTTTWQVGPQAPELAASDHPDLKPASKPTF